MKTTLLFILMACLFGCHHNTQPQRNTASVQEKPSSTETRPVNPESLMADFAHRY